MTPHPFDVYHSSKIREGARRSALEIVPLFIDWLNPRSVVDVGCGAGAWLSVFHQFGVTDSLGIDGAWVDQTKLEISSQKFVTWDLKEMLQVGRRFDLILSLEVAHLLAPNRAESFVRSLAGLGPTIAFSAGVPGQWGRLHLNEQWPAYWARLFEQSGFVAIDCLRHRVWQNENVDWWYSQNTFLYVRAGRLKEYPHLNLEFDSTSGSVQSLVHPAHYQQHLWMYRVLRAALTVSDRVPRGETLALVDEAQFGDNFVTGRRVVRLFESEGLYGGPPEDAQLARAELEHVVRSGAGRLAIGWPSFWWLDHYAAFSEYLRKSFHCAWKDGNVMLFDLRTRPSGAQ